MAQRYYLCRMGLTFELLKKDLQSKARAGVIRLALIACLALTGCYDPGGNLATREIQIQTEAKSNRKLPLPCPCGSRYGDT
jgi:hypothetical protein